MNIINYDNKGVFVADSSMIDGDGVIEEASVINGALKGRFVLGAYSLVDEGAECKNALIGRFSVIEKNCVLGYRTIRSGFFSNHHFAQKMIFPAEDEYFSKIKTGRNFFETDKYTFIGNDVLVGQGSIVEEGVVVGDGAIILPGSYVSSDIPPYAVVGGQPAVMQRYRFSKQEIEQLLSSKWWMKDISGVLNKYFNLNLMNYGDSSEIISRIYQNSAAILNKKRYWVNTGLGVFDETAFSNIIVGPSHVDIWNKKIQNKTLKRPAGFYLYPISAVSSFSDQLFNLTKWWSAWMGNVILFVPDFRIGNAGVGSIKKDARFIDQKFVSEKNSKECYLAGVSALDVIGAIPNLRFWFWCLNGREELNKKKGTYVDSSGKYRHPLWNYDHMLKRYGSKVIDIKKFFPEVEGLIVDASIHPTDECYRDMAKIFEEYNWK